MTQTLEVRSDAARRGWVARRAAMNEAFWDRADRSGGPDACWPWRGARWTPLPGRPAYGVVRVNLRRVLTHRHALELATGRAIEPGLVVMHTCDNPPCVNPAHLRTGTKADNSADMVAKGRQYRPARGPRRADGAVG